MHGGLHSTPVNTRTGIAAHAHLAAHANCTTANPDLFDATEYETAWPALSYCYGCPVATLCEQIVQPATSYYDGVAGARVWRNGLRITVTGKAIGKRSRQSTDNTRTR